MASSSEEGEPAIPFSSEDDDDGDEDATDLVEYPELLEIVDAGQALKNLLSLVIDHHVKKLIGQACVPDGDDYDHQELALDAVDLDPAVVAEKFKGLLNDNFRLGPSLRNVDVDFVDVLWANPIKLETAKKLIEAGADVNYRFDHEIKLESLKNITPLILLASKDVITSASTEAARMLIEAGAEIDAEDSTQHGTALAYATSNGNYELSKLLMDKGANIKWKNKQGTSLFLNTAWKGHLNLCSLFVDHGADLTSKNALGQNALMLAAERGHLQICKYLVEQHSFAVDEVDAKGYTALILASEEGHLEVVKYLLSHGAEIDRWTKSGDTALLQAAYFGHKELCYELVGNGASVNARNQNGITPLKAAALKDQMVDFCRVLLEKGADANDSEQITALIIAARYGSLEICRLLCEVGKADMTLTGGEQNFNSMFVAAAAGHFEVLLYLLEHAAKLRKTTVDEIVKNDRDHCNHSLFYWAVFNKHQEIINYLMKHGADEAEMRKAQRERNISESSK